jgi:hypothetical protein
MTALVPVPITPPTTSEHAWIELLGPAADLANMIAATDFVPAELRNKPAAITACILYGQEIGIGPMQSLSKIDIVKGRPAPRAELARALALAAGHEVWVEESTNTRVKVCGRRRGSQIVQSATWTMDDAKKAGLTGNQTYTKYPRQMLLARASAELVRMVCPEVLGGITVFAEEAADLDVADNAPAAPAPAAEVKPSNKRQRPAARPPAEPVEPEPVRPAEDRLPSPQQTKMAMALFGQNGFDARDDRLHVTSAILARPVDSWTDVSAVEAGQVIDVLEEIGRGEANIVIGDDDEWTVTRRDPAPVDGDDGLPLLPDEAA